MYYLFPNTKITFSAKEFLYFMDRPIKYYTSICYAYQSFCILFYVLREAIIVLGLQIIVYVCFMLSIINIME